MFVIPVNIYRALKGYPYGLDVRRFDYNQELSVVNLSRDFDSAVRLVKTIVPRGWYTGPYRIYVADSNSKLIR